MALIQCKECGGQVSTLAVACPHCGAPQPTATLAPPMRPPIPSAKHDPAPPKGSTSKRITLTKAQANSAFGNELIKFLFQITEDGTLTLDEVRQLQGWLQSNEMLNIPAVSYLLEIVAGILADGKIDLTEAYELRSGIERVLPKEHRDEVSKKLSRIERPATESQLEYIQILGGAAPQNLTLSAASAMIENLLRTKPPTPRQMMVLRFWDRLDLMEYGKNGVSDWMDQWYMDDPDRQRAWELYKKDSNDDGSHRNPERVPVGVGNEYLNRVKTSALSSSSRKGCLSLCVGFLLLVILAIRILCTR